MLTRVRSLLTVIVLALPHVAAAQPVAKRRPPDPVSTYLQQDKYTYCDVKILSALWKQPVRDAKARVGAQLQRGNHGYLTAQLTRARANARKFPRARCSFGEAGFSYDDVAKLAKLWRTNEGEAKAIAESKILEGNEAYVRELVRGGAPVAQDPVSTYLQQDKYTYCDVKLLSARWRSSAADAKARIGLKIQTGNDPYLDTELAAARRLRGVRCNYAEAGFTYADVETLSRMWRMPVGKTKVQIERKVRAGNAQGLREMLGGTQTELATFLNQDKYTYCDAKMIAGMWKQSVTEGKTFIGAKLAANSTPTLDRTIAKARLNAQRNRGVRCAFHEAGFSYQDALTLAKLWSVSTAEAKAMAEEKIAFGGEAGVRLSLRARPPVKRPAPRPPTR